DRALNEWDACAVEEALLIREAGEGEVVVLTVGDAEADAVLRRSLAMGADRAIRIESDAGDPIGVARALAEAIGPLDADLVLCGVQSSDAVQAATGTALAELLGLPRVAVARKLEYDHAGRQATAHRALEGRLRDVTRELVSTAQELGGPVSVAVIAKDPAAFDLALQGVDEVIRVGVDADEFENDVYQQAVEALIAERSPQVVLMGFTVNSIGYGPALAAKLGLGFASDVHRLARDGDAVVATRSFYGGKV